jgi:hypothetical protein
MASQRTVGIDDPIPNTRLDLVEPVGSRFSVAPRRRPKALAPAEADQDLVTSQGIIAPFLNSDAAHAFGMPTDDSPTPGPEVGSPRYLDQIKADYDAAEAQRNSQSASPVPEAQRAGSDAPSIDLRGVQALDQTQQRAEEMGRQRFFAAMTNVAKGRQGQRTAKNPYEAQNEFLEKYVAMPVEKYRAQKDAEDALAAQKLGAVLGQAAGIDTTGMATEKTLPTIGHLASAQAAARERQALAKDTQQFQAQQLASRLAEIEHQGSENRALRETIAAGQQGLTASQQKLTEQLARERMDQKQEDESRTRVGKYLASRQGAVQEPELQQFAKLLIDLHSGKAVPGLTPVQTGLGAGVAAKLPVAGPFVTSLLTPESQKAEAQSNRARAQRLVNLYRLSTTGQAAGEKELARIESTVMGAGLGPRELEKTLGPIIAKIVEQEGERSALLQTPSDRDKATAAGVSVLGPDKIRKYREAIGALGY